IGCGHRKRFGALLREAGAHRDVGHAREDSQISVALRGECRKARVGRGWVLQLVLEKVRSAFACEPALRRWNVALRELIECGDGGFPSAVRRVDLGEQAERGAVTWLASEHVAKPVDRRFALAE